MTLTKRLFLSTFISLVLATGSKAQIKLQSGQKVAFLGDSITQFGWDRPGGYVHLVAQGLEAAGVKIDVIPAGVSGNTSRDMIGRIEASVISKKPDWMTLSCGINDVWHGATGVELEPYKTNITAIVDKAQAAGIKVLILTTTVINESDNANNQKLVAYNDFLRQLAKERNLPVADLNGIFWKALKDNPKTHLTVDGVHMNPEGNMLMARGIMEGFGMPAAQVDAYETTWRQSPDAASVIGQVAFNGVAGVSLKAYSAMADVARERKISPNELQQDLLFEALRAVLKAHEQDATFTPAQATAELQKAFSEKVDEAAAAVTPAPAKP